MKEIFAEGVEKLQLGLISCIRQPFSQKCKCLPRSCWTSFVVVSAVALVEF